MTVDVAALREALNDLWGCIGSNEIRDLQPETIEIAIVNHRQLDHDYDDQQTQRILDDPGLLGELLGPLPDPPNIELS